MKKPFPSANWERHRLPDLQTAPARPPAAEVRLLSKRNWPQVAAFRQHDLTSWFPRITRCLPSAAPGLSAAGEGGCRSPVRASSRGGGDGTPRFCPAAPRRAVQLLSPLWAGARAAEVRQQPGEGLQQPGEGPEDPAEVADWGWRREGGSVRTSAIPPPALEAGTGTRLYLTAPQETCFEPRESCWVSVSAWSTAVGHRGHLWW